MTTQKTQARQRLGAFIKQARRKQDMKTQDALADATGLSVSVISLAERGHKVEAQTLRTIAIALGFPSHSFENYAEGRAAELPTLEQEAPEAPEQPRSVITMTREELVDAAALVEEVLGADEADRFLQEALDKRRKARQGKSPSESEEDTA